MREDRKHPHDKPGRGEPQTHGADSVEFSIESTTMRLHSMKIRRAVSAERDGQPRRDRATPEAASTATASNGPTGRVRHDERGMAVWDFAVATGEFATLSATNLMRKLDSDALAIDETQRSAKVMEPQGRDEGGGGDPYNTRGAGQRVGEAAKRQGVTGAADRPRASVLEQLAGRKK